MEHEVEMWSQRVVWRAWRLADDAIAVSCTFNAHLMLAEIAVEELNVLRRDRDVYAHAGIVGQAQRR
jgi:hypothetical protein